MFAILVAILTLLTILIIIKLTRNIKNNKEVGQLQIDKWMNMSYKERLKYDLEHKKKVARRKKVLLEQIRREYIKVNSKRNKK